MSDETPEPEEQPGTPPEPEGGPFEREREFLEERMSRMRPKGDGEPGESEPGEAAEKRQSALEAFRRLRRQAQPPGPPEEPPSTQEESGQPETPFEPEGGPFEREREFLEERMARARPKGEGPPDMEPAPIPIPPEPGPEEAAPLETPTLDTSPFEALSEAAEKRQRALEEFRRLRRQKLRPGPPEGPPATPEDRLEFPPPPEPPVPPPANNWIPIGPSVLRQGQGGIKPATSGRTPAIAVAPGGTRIYIGAANGGVWRSDDAGQTWRSLMEAFDLNPRNLASDSLAVGAIAIDPSNPDRIFVGSGEGAGGAYFGVGPVVSFDGGNNWNPPEPVAPGSLPLAGSSFYALAMDPGNPDRLVSGSRRGLHRREPDGSGGFHWVGKSLPGALVPAGSTQPWVTSVVAAQTGGVTTFYAACLFGPVYSSPDGNTWTQAGSGFPNTNVSRISLAVQPNNPAIVYALVTNRAAAGSVPEFGHLLGVYRLDTADGAWRQVTGAPDTLFGPILSRRGQGTYDSAIAVAPDNANRIYLGGSTAYSDGMSIVPPGTPGADWSAALYRCEVTVSGTSASMTPTYIGGSVHADVHTLVFAPGDANQLWAGCDGGVFYSTNPTGIGSIFTARNTGLQTLTMNYLGQHPTEDAVLFAGTQDNGGERFTGEEAWLYSSGGDGGFAIVNWNDPYKILSTYVQGGIRRSMDGGRRYSFSSVNVPLATNELGQVIEPVLFYAPIAGTPPNPGSPAAAADADRVAFGSIRPWISTTFGGGWQSIPHGTLEGDRLDERIKSLAFASPTRLYAGTMGGGVYRLDRSGTTWTRTRIDTIGSEDALPPDGIPVTDIAVDPANDGRIYITFGGTVDTGDLRRVWFFDGFQWEQRSGPAAGSMGSLLDVQANAIVVDPANPAHLYVGTDIGVWRSTNSGATWEPFSEGLPDAAVLDLALHNARRLLRASTHGRSVYERTLPDTPQQGIELYVRDTQLDQGRFTTANWLPDPTAMGQTVRHWAGPDIKLDTPDALGQYQFPLTGSIDFHQFVDALSDDARNVATHATATITTRVYVQVHNRGVLPADNVRVMLLLANASAGLPALPAGYWIDVQTGMPINNANWRTVGIVHLNDVRVGAPKIAGFDLTSDMLPPPANLAGNNHHCVLALIHHPNDPYTSTITNTDNNSLAVRKAAHKNLTVVQFTGALPASPPVFIPFRIHNPELEREILTGMILDLARYPGRARLYSPPLKTDQPLEQAVSGLKIDQEFESFKQWAEEHIRMIRENLESDTPYDQEWSLQRIQDIERALETGFMFKVEEAAKEAEIHGIQMEPDSSHTFFLALDRPEDGQTGQHYAIEIIQINDEQIDITGGLSIGVELVQEPEL